MKQVSKFLIHSCLFLICGAIGAAGMTSAAELSPRQKQLNNQAEACKSKKDYGCAKICLVAAKNPGKTSLGEKCDQSYRAVIPASSQPSGPPQPKELRLVLRDQARFCQIKKDRPCAQACAAATKNSGDATAVQQCHAEYQRVLAANPPAPKRPEESMTLAQRIALMPDKAAYCKAKKAMNTEIGMRRPLDGCIDTCSSNRVSDPNYPERQREGIVLTCENLYYAIFQKLGK